MGFSTSGLLKFLGKVFLGGSGPPNKPVVWEQPSLFHCRKDPELTIEGRAYKIGDHWEYWLFRANEPLRVRLKGGQSRRGFDYAVSQLSRLKRPPNLVHHTGQVWRAQFGYSGMADEEHELWIDIGKMEVQYITKTGATVWDQ